MSSSCPRPGKHRVVQRRPSASGSPPLRPDRLMANPSLTLPNEVRNPIGDVVLDELVQRILAGETLRPNNFEPKLVTR
jgi:hypothetical protein